MLQNIAKALQISAETLYVQAGILSPDDHDIRSVEAAILKASPLPYAGFEDEFIRDPVLKFRARDAIDR